MTDRATCSRPTQLCCYFVFYNMSAAQSTKLGPRTLERPWNPSGPYAPIYGTPAHGNRASVNPNMVRSSWYITDVNSLFFAAPEDLVHPWLPPLFWRQSKSSQIIEWFYHSYKLQSGCNLLPPTPFLNFPGRQKQCVNPVGCLLVRHKVSLQSKPSLFSFQCLWLKNCGSQPFIFF